jgi:hypothetical protein
MLNPQYAARIIEYTRLFDCYREEFNITEPNKFWFIDDHIKFELYKIKIYTVIDIYSRYVLWIYVSVTARTQISVLFQYMKCFHTIERKRLIIRNDRNIEILIFADCYLALSRKNDLYVKLDDICYYEISIKNQRVKSF